MSITAIASPSQEVAQQVEAPPRTPEDHALQNAVDQFVRKHYFSDERCQAIAQAIGEVAPRGGKQAGEEADLRDRVNELIEKPGSLEQIVEVFTDLFQRYGCTAEDVRALENFYDTSLGQKWAKAEVDAFLAGQRGAGTLVFEVISELPDLPQADQEQEAVPAVAAQ